MRKSSLKLAPAEYETLLTKTRIRNVKETPHKTRTMSVRKLLTKTVMRNVTNFSLKLASGV